ncbi:MAG: serine/threonine-protein phosphatase [Butyrivibrio sp.]|nr:serine/threonine-protein phosphatase [Butyrivibrio sp.]
MEFSALTKTGTEHELNEDRLCINNKLLKEGSISGNAHPTITAIICDGVGSEAGGAEAATIAAECFCGKDIDVRDMNQTLSQLIHVNEIIKNFQKKNSAFQNCASTIAGITMTDSEFVIFNAGDTRVYIFRRKHLIQLSQDHTKAQEMFDWKRIPSTNSVSRRYRNMLTAYLGGYTDEFTPYITKKRYFYKPGDLIILCSDGIYKSIKEEDIEQILEQKISLQEKCKAMQKLALQAGTTDDLSVVLINPAN